MNSHNHPDGILDLSLSRGLKNWVDRKNAPTYGRGQLLAAAAQQTMLLPQQKPQKFNFGWSFRFQDNLEAFTIQSAYGCALESIYSLNARMAFL